MVLAIFSKTPHLSNSSEHVSFSVAANTSRETAVFGTLVVLWAPASTTVSKGRAPGTALQAGIFLVANFSTHCGQRKALARSPGATGNDAAGLRVVCLHVVVCFQGH